MSEKYIHFLKEELRSPKSNLKFWPNVIVLFK